MNAAAEAIAPLPGQEPLSSIPGVGLKTAAILSDMGLNHLSDLLLWLPIRYEDRTCVVPIDQLSHGRKAQVCGIVHRTKMWRRGKRDTLICTLRDDTGEIQVMFFHYARYARSNLSQGTRVLCYGEAREGRSGGLEMAHPNYQRLKQGQPIPLESSLMPIYRVAKGLHQKLMRKLVNHALDNALPHLHDILPPEYFRSMDLPSLPQAIRILHHPPAELTAPTVLARRHPAFRRLVLEEILAWQVAVRQARNEANRRTAPVLQPDGKARKEFLAALPFELTPGQARAIAEIDVDLTKSTPMMRLLQGDVGCGKTVVIAAAAMAAVESGMQTAIMAPTELLAEQHMRTLSEWLNPLGIRTAWLTGTMPVAVRRMTIGNLATGHAQVVCGTHALFQKSVRYRALGLVVMDEQHRFGVHHRLNLLQKRADEALPHQLITTATPIPRSLAMTFYAGMDFSVIPDMPAGRQPVETALIPQDRRSEVIERVAKACRAGRQAYWVCPLIEESDEIESQDVTTVKKELSEALQGLRVASVHGQVKSKDRDWTMREFTQGKINVLVATTIVEVGVDVPNSSLMIIENAERLGLTQLHQLRGRVGRGAEQSYCVLLYRTPLGEVAKQRLWVMRNTNDGFEIARQDLKLRGPGEILSVRQTGMGDFRLANLERDHDLVEPAQRLADRLLNEHPQRAQQLTERWIRKDTQYVQV